MLGIAALLWGAYDHRRLNLTDAVDMKTTATVIDKTNKTVARKSNRTKIFLAMIYKIDSEIDYDEQTLISINKKKIYNISPRKKSAKKALERIKSRLLENNINSDGYLFTSLQAHSIYHRSHEINDRVDLYYRSHQPWKPSFNLERERGMIAFLLGFGILCLFLAIIGFVSKSTLSR